MSAPSRPGPRASGSLAPWPWTTVRRPVIAMLHAPALPGSPCHGGSWKTIEQAVLRDAEVLAQAGVTAWMLENFGDAPFYPDRVPPETVAAMTALALTVRQRFSLPLGINVLRNDGRAALAIAAVVGAAFIRVNVLCGARVTDQGLIQGAAHELLRDRARLGCGAVQILADLDVKHSAPLAPQPLEDELRDLVERGGADAVIVTGRGTGVPADLKQLAGVKFQAGDVPVLVGSGVTADDLSTYLPFADGFIVGSALKQEGRAAAPVDPERVKAWMSAHAAIQG